MITCHRFHCQQGATLIIALIFMVLLTVISLSSMHSSSFEIKVARSVKSQIDALIDAEDALAIGEQLVKATHDTSYDPSFADPDNGLFDTNQLNNLASLSAYLSTSAALPSASQRYIVEYLGSVAPNKSSKKLSCSGCDRRSLFRVTASGQSAKGGFKLIQSHYYTTTD